MLKVKKMLNKTLLMNLKWRRRKSLLKKESKLKNNSKEKVVNLLRVRVNKEKRKELILLNLKLLLRMKKLRNKMNL